MATSRDQAACKKKKRFSSDAAAQAALKKINPAKAYRNRPTRVYKCPVCAGFHLTSQKPQ